MDFQPWAWGPVRSDLPGTRLDDSHRALLAAPVLENEIWAAINSLFLGKAPGLDGFGASFYHSYWSIIKGKAAISKFCSTGFMPAKWKSTLVIFIPKKHISEHVSDFRPISLCSFTYKICTGEESSAICHLS